MVSIMNDYVSKIILTANAMLQGVLQTALNEQENVDNSSIIIKSNRFIVDVHLTEFSIENAVKAADVFMEKTEFHYSAFYIRFNEGSRVRYRYASCKEDKEGFYCDIVIS